MKNSYIRLKSNRNHTIFIIIISIINIILYLYSGFLFGFSNSPYSHEILTLLTNILPKIFIILGVETTRAILLRNKKNKKTIVLITTLLILVQINFNVLINMFTNKELLFQYICSSIIPLIACNIFYSYLALNGLYLEIIIYRLLTEMIIFILPILPNIDWFITGAFGTLFPAIVYVLFKYTCLKKKNHIRRKKKDFHDKVSYAITFICLIVLICFMLGFFKYELIAILSNSMIPSFNRGDVVIFRKINDSEIRNIPKNTIIIYSIEGKNVAHRVVDKIEKNNNILYKTKGDKNNVADTKLVQTNQIKGIYTFHIKYIGFPSIWLYEYFNKK